MSETAPLRLIRAPDLVAKLGLSRATIYRRIAEGTFPEPRQVGAQAVAWLETEVDQWILQQPTIRRRRRPQGA